MEKCPYRADKECQKTPYQISMNSDKCKLCLIGMQADELSLLNSAIGNLTASLEESKMEAIHKEEYE